MFQNCSTIERMSTHTTNDKALPDTGGRKQVRGRRAKRRSMLESPELRWKAGRQERWVTVTKRPLNRRLIETDVGLVHVKDNTRFQVGLNFPCWVEQDSGRVIARGLPRQLHRW